MMKTTVAILASGSGTTAEAFIRSIVAEHQELTVPIVICNNSQAGVLDRITCLNEELGLHIETLLINAQTHPAAPGEQVTRGQQTVAEQRAVLEALRKNDVNLVLLLGFMKHIGTDIIDTYGWRPSYASIYQARMLNTHPGLLPATKGLFGIHVQKAVLQQEQPEAGQSLHMVSTGYDEGPVVYEHRVRVEPDDTAETLFTRVQQTEKAHIASDVADFIRKQHGYNQGGN